MKEFIRDFHKRVAEIDKYFDLVDRIEQLGAFSTSSITFPSGEYVVDSDLQKILKSHCYLLLYNLIESSIRNGITAIHDAISLDRLTYRTLSPKMKKLWVLNDLSKSFRDSYIKKETVAKNLQDVIGSILDDEIVTLDATNIPISGNLDAKTIKELIKMYGFYGNLGISERDIDNTLSFVVKIRCDLAHGNVSFSDASNEIIWKRPVSDVADNARVYRYLVEDKEKIVQYLTHLLNNISNYIDNKIYKIP
jgi:MAE_28990/MAE_18760-like HEPN